MRAGGTEKYVIRILGSLSKKKFRTFVIIDEKIGALLPELITKVDEVVEIKNQIGFFNRVTYLYRVYKFLHHLFYIIFYYHLYTLFHHLSNLHNI